MEKDAKPVSKGVFDVEDPATPRDTPGLRAYVTHERVAEILAAIILSMVALSTSWAGYQASLWDGEEAEKFSQANAARTKANRAAVEAGIAESADFSMFTHWLDARADGDARREALYRERIRPEFRPAFEAWIALRPFDEPNAPSTPFTMQQYRIQRLERSQALEQRADALFEDGQRARRNSNGLGRAAVFLAAAMFFGGIGQTFESNKVKFVLLGAGALGCAVGLVLMFATPMMSPS